MPKQLMNAFYINSSNRKRLAISNSKMVEQFMECSHNVMLRKPLTFMLVNLFDDIDIDKQKTKFNVYMIVF